VPFTDAGIKHFYTLMQTRYATRLVSYFSTNYGRDGIKKMLASSGDPQDIEVAEAIIRRMIGTKAEPRAHLIQFKRHKRAAATKGGKAAPVC
jgi:hypothetical protein